VRKRCLGGGWQVPSGPLRRSRAGIRPLTVVLVAAACAVLAAVVPCAAREHERARDEPRLILPGSRTVEPGEWIVLEWVPADSVRELELLLSLDGGRTWPVCISPSLGPERCTFRWQVPANAARDLRLRIRFNRGGREIEGAPSGPLLVTNGTRGEPLPLGLPAPLPDPVRTSNEGRADAASENRSPEGLAAPSEAATPRGLRASVPPKDAVAHAPCVHLNEPLRVPMRT